MNYHPKGHAAALGGHWRPNTVVHTVCRRRRRCILLPLLLLRRHILVRIPQAAPPAHTQLQPMWIRPHLLHITVQPFDGGTHYETKCGIRRVGLAQVSGSAHAHADACKHLLEAPPNNAASVASSSDELSAWLPLPLRFLLPGVRSSSLPASMSTSSMLCGVSGSAGCCCCAAGPAGCPAPCSTGCSAVGGGPKTPDRSSCRHSDQHVRPDTQCRCRHETGLEVCQWQNAEWKPSRDYDVNIHAGEVAGPNLWERGLGLLQRCDCLLDVIQSAFVHIALVTHLHAAGQM